MILKMMEPAEFLQELDMVQVQLKVFIGGAQILFEQIAHSNSDVH